jgi:tetratricopeptide (TPR) repeat protein
MPPILERAIECFEVTVAKDPSFARGWASLAEAYAYASAYVGRDLAEDTRRAESAARRAVSLDDKLAAGHAMLGAVMLFLRWNFKAAETEYRRAIDLDPQGAYAIVEYADLLRETGRVEEAEAVIIKTRALLPKLPVLAVKQAEIWIGTGPMPPW